MADATNTEPAVLIERDGAVATIVLNRPERMNAWGSDLEEGTIAALHELRDDDSVRAVVLTGSGGAFSAGANLQDPDTHHTPNVEAAMDRRMQARSAASTIFDLVDEYPKPIAAAVHGYAIGFGCLLPFCCDFIYAGESARFQLPQVALGIIPAYGGALRVVRAVGKLNAAEMILTGRMVDSDDAARWGIAAKVLPDDQLLAYTQDVMRTIADHPPVAVALARESLKTSVEANDMAAAKLSDLHRSMLLTARSDTAARHQAWRERRQRRAAARESREG